MFFCIQDAIWGLCQANSGIFDCINLLDFEECTASRFDIKNSSVEVFDLKNDPHTTLNKKTAARIEERDHDRFWEFTDLSTLETRMTFIPIERKNAKVTKMVVTTQIIDSEKTELINLIYKSSTDELTRLYNRRTYEDDLDKLEKNKELVAEADKRMYVDKAAYYKRTGIERRKG